MYLNTLQMPLQPPNKKTPRSSSRPSYFHQLHNFIAILISCLFLFSSNTIFVNAQATTNGTATISISYLDTSGTPLADSQPQSIPQSACTLLNTFASSSTTLATTTTPDDTPSNDSTPTQSIPYAFVSASDQHAALNLYTDAYCQVMVSATVGFWNTNTTTPSLIGIKAVRWEGTAPSSMTPGTLNPVAFPPNMITQPLAPVEEDGTPKKKHDHHKHQEFVVDPARGRAVVGLVSAVLLVGIVIGVREVYKAAQYVPPARSRPGSVSSGNSRRGFGGGYDFDVGVIGTVGARRVKKKDAYFRKSTASSIRPDMAREDGPQQQQQQLSTARTSTTTLATLRATTSPVTIDMNSGESPSSLQLHPIQAQSESSSLSLSSSYHSRAQKQPPRLEVLVPLPSPEGKSSFFGSIDTKQT
jgi:hypothetical protein